VRRVLIYRKHDLVKVGLSEEEAYEALLERCRKGWIDRGMKHKAQDLYLHRLHYELKLIKEKQFVDYFLIVADMVDWAKGQGILVGPARGSGSGLARGVSHGDHRSRPNRVGFAL